MSQAGYSGTPLPRKLGIKEGHRVAVFDAPGHIDELLADLPPSVLMKGPGGRGRFDVILAFVSREIDLVSRFDRARRRMEIDGGLWICWPKQSSPLATELREAHVRSYGLSTGLVDNKVCAIDADWSGLRFVVRLEDRPRG